MRNIDPDLFTRIMRLPETVRSDLLEFLGATPFGDAELAKMIERLSQVADKRRPALRYAPM